MLFRQSGKLICLLFKNIVNGYIKVYCYLTFYIPFFAHIGVEKSTNSHLYDVTPFRPLRFLFPCLSFADEEAASLNMIKSAPVGPVAGGIMGCIMVLVLVVYAYRHQIHRRSHQHMSPLAAQGESDRIHTNTPTQRPGTECQG